MSAAWEQTDPATRAKPRQRAKAPSVTVLRNGHLYLNGAAWQALGRPITVLISWNAEQAEVMIEWCDPADPRGYRVSVGRQIGASALRRQAGFPDYATSVRRPATMDERGRLTFKV